MCHMIRFSDIVLPPLNRSSPTLYSANRMNRSKNFSYSMSLYKNTPSSQTTTDTWLTSIRCLCQHSHDDNVRFLIADVYKASWSPSSCLRQYNVLSCTIPSVSPILVQLIPVSRRVSIWSLVIMYLGTCFFARNPRCWLNTACLSLNLSGIDFIQQALRKRL